MEFKLEEEKNLPLGRILLVIILCVVFIFFGLKLHNDGRNVEKAEALYAMAKDDFEASRLERSLVEINRALKLKEDPKYLEVKVNVLVNQGKHSEGVPVGKKPG